MKKINIDVVVGIFLIVGFLAFVYVSLQFGEFSIFNLEKNYTIVAEFDNVSGLKKGATVEIGGVTVGKVAAIMLNEDNRAQVAMSIIRGTDITEDTMASIRTQGIIGDKYIRLLQGGSDVMLEDGGLVEDTESAIDLEELVSKYIFGDL